MLKLITRRVSSQSRPKAGNLLRVIYFITILVFLNSRKPAVGKIVIESLQYQDKISSSCRKTSYALLCPPSCPLRKVYTNSTGQVFLVPHRSLTVIRFRYVPANLWRPLSLSSLGGISMLECTSSYRQRRSGKQAHLAKETKRRDVSNRFFRRDKGSKLAS